MHKCKWIVITGGVLSGLGKGIVSASIGRLLSSKYKVVPVKCDGYLNIDPGTMNPIEHGEVFVLEDGGEVDMDFGHYERFLNLDCKFDWNLTSGKVFKHVIDKERKGEYLGKTVQMIPHVTNEIKRRLNKIAKDEKADIMLVEIGGTVGDIETMLFIEAVRQLKNDVGRENIMYSHLTLVPILSCVGEEKTKPTQQSVSMLQQRGIQADVIIARSPRLLPQKVKQKIALFASLYPEEIISDPDMDSVYELPLIFEKEGLLNVMSKKLDLYFKSDLSEWSKLVKNIKDPKSEVNVVICGKYTELKDSYVSVKEALVHAGAHNNCRVNIKLLETTDIETGKKDIKSALKDVHGVIVPGGFGDRGIEGKIEVIKHARENGVPFLGLCYGLQLAVVEFARNMCGLKEANTTEVKNTKEPVVDILPEQKEISDKGGTMRLGGYDARLESGSKVHLLYESSTVASERHRHRYEVNPEYHSVLKENGLILSGLSPDKRLVEYIELKKHPYFVATQSHPELKSRLERPAPLFVGFIKACKDGAKK